MTLYIIQGHFKIFDIIDIYLLGDAGIQINYIVIIFSNPYPLPLGFNIHPSVL